MFNQVKALMGLMSVSAMRMHWSSVWTREANVAEVGLDVDC